MRVKYLKRYVILYIIKIFKYKGLKLMTSSLTNFALSLIAGSFVVIAIATALIWVSSNDQIIRD